MSLNALCGSLKNAGWSSLVARQAHNLKVAGSNPAPATKSGGLPHSQSSFPKFLVFNGLGSRSGALRNEQ
jgi:hypothetical protein